MSTKKNKSQKELKAKTKHLLKEMRGDVNEEKVARVISAINFNSRLLLYMEQLPNDKRRLKQKFAHILGGNIVDIITSTVNILGAKYIDYAITELQELVTTFYAFLEDNELIRAAFGAHQRFSESDETVYFSPGIYLIIQNKDESSTSIHFIESTWDIKDDKSISYNIPNPNCKHAILQIFSNDRVKCSNVFPQPMIDATSGIDLALSVRSETPSLVSLVYNSSNSGFTKQELDLILYKNGLPGFIMIDDAFEVYTYGDSLYVPLQALEFFKEPIKGGMRISKKMLDIKPKSPEEFGISMDDKFPANCEDAYTKIIRTGYDDTSYLEYVLGFIRWACEYENAWNIDMTLYRLSASSPIIDWLELAGKRGVFVNVYIELSARGDEINNSIIYKRLSAANNVRVHWWGNGLKVHAKLFAMTDKRGIRWIHTSTGNYNEERASQFHDIQVFTKRPTYGLGWGATNFNDLIYACMKDQISVRNGPDYLPVEYDGILPISGYSSVNRVNYFITNALTSMQDVSGSYPRRVIIKVNHFLDDRIMNKLIMLALSGVRVDLIIRTTIPKMLENISSIPNLSVYSVVGKTLEHDRIYYFEYADGTREAAISSADLMYRNLYNRAESLFVFERIQPDAQSEIYDTLNETLTRYIDAGATLESPAIIMEPKANLNEGETPDYMVFRLL